VDPKLISVCKYCGAPPSPDKNKWEEFPICRITNNMRLKDGGYQLDWVTKRYFWPRCDRCYRAQKKGLKVTKLAGIISILLYAFVGVVGSIVFDTYMWCVGLPVGFVAFFFLLLIISKLSDINAPEKDPEIAEKARQRLSDEGWELGRRIPLLVKQNSTASPFTSRIEKKYVGSKSPENMVGGRWIYPKEYIFAQVNEKLNKRRR